MSDAKSKWDKRYAAKGDPSTCAIQAPDFLLRNITKLKRGRVLDLAAGDGASSLVLAEYGFDVVAVDISPVGLTRLEQRLLDKGHSCATYSLDLETDDVDLTGLGQFDAIVISRYKPLIGVWPVLVEQLVEGGHLLLTTFNMHHHDRTGFSKRFCLSPDELITPHPSLTLCSYEADLNAAGMDSYLFVKE